MTTVSDERIWDSDEPQRERTMSWSVSAKGTKDFCVETCTKQFDSIYGMSELEQADVTAARARVLALLDGLKQPAQYAGKDIAVSAHGSHSTYPDGVGEASFSVKVSFTSI